MDGVNTEQADGANDQRTSTTAPAASTHATDCNVMVDEEDSQEASVTEEVMVLNTEDEGDCAQSDPPSSEDQVTESITKREQPPIVKLVKTTEDSITVSVSGGVQEDHSVMISSLAAFEVKDVRRESGGMLLVVGITNEAKNGAVHELVEEIKTVLEEACSVAARQRKILASTNMESAVQGDAVQDADAAEEALKQEGKASTEGEGVTRPVSLTERRRAREARKLSQADSQQNASEAMSVARNPSRSETMANKAREALGRPGQDLPQIQEQLGEAVAGAAMSSTVASVQADHTGSLDTEKGIGLAIESVAPQRPRQSDVTPGAFYTPGRAFGAPPEWNNQSTGEQPTYQEAVTHNRGQASGNMDTSEVSPVVKAFKVDESATEEHVRRRILEETVEADVIDQVAVKRRRSRRRLVFILIVILLAGIAISLGVALSTKPSNVFITEAPSMAPSTSPTEATRPTLEKVRSRGAVRCGTFDNLPGLYALSEERNQYEGFNVDLCTAIAAAAVGNSSSLEIVPIADSSRFKALLNGSIDVLARIDTHTMSREVVEATTGMGFSFSTPFLYSGLVFKGIPEFVDCAESLDPFFGICGQLKICVFKDSSHEKTLDTLFPSSFIHRTRSEIGAFANGTCNVVAAEPVFSHDDVFEAAGYEGPLKPGMIPFSRDPLALVTRRGDPEWSDLVNAVLQSLMAAEVQNVTKLTADTFRSTTALGNFTENMFSDAIAAVGNYGEMFTRHLDGVVFRSGLNSLNLNGSTGLLYSFPFGATEELGPGPVEGGTLQAIRDRGYLRCGLSSNITGFAEFNTTSQKWSGFDVSFCRVVLAAVFADEYDASRGYATNSILDQYATEKDGNIEFISLSDVDQYVALGSGTIDVLAGGMASFVNDVLEPTSSTGFSFSSPYFYGSSDGIMSDESTRALATRQDDTQWSAFVYWTLMSTIFAEEQHIGRNKANLMPVVNLFGDRFAQMFKSIVASNGNFGDIYEGVLAEHIPRAGRNQLNSNDHHGPQQYPYRFP